MSLLALALILSQTTTPAPTAAPAPATTPADTQATLNELREATRRLNEAAGFESPKRGIHRAGRQLRRIHDVEAESMPLGERLEDKESCVGEHICVAT